MKVTKNDVANLRNILKLKTLIPGCWTWGVHKGKEQAIMVRWPNGKGAIIPIGTPRFIIWISRDKYNYFKPKKKRAKGVKK